MSTNKQRREAERARLQRQLAERRAQEARRRRLTTIGSVVAALVVIAVVVVVVVTATGGDDKPAASTPTGSAAPTASDTAAATPTAAADPVLDTPCQGPSGANATLDGVTVTGATDLAKAPGIKAAVSTQPATLLCRDLVVGTGTTVTASDTVNTQYVGALLKDGTVFNNSFSSGGPVPFPLSNVVPGFRLGIAGSGKVAAMKVGGRRLLILPASLAYGSSARTGIPADSALIFIVDAKSIGS